MRGVYICQCCAHEHGYWPLDGQCEKCSGPVINSSFDPDVEFDPDIEEEEDEE